MEGPRPGPVRVREARAEDAPTLVALNRAVQDVHVRRRPDLFRAVDDMPGALEHYRAVLSDPRRHVFVAEVDGHAVGYVLAEVQERPANPFTHAFRRVWVDQISVETEARRHGVGRALMERVEALARTLGIDTVGLDTWSFNETARAFFVGLGYEASNLRFFRTLPDPGQGGRGPSS